jgi:hypothetical protein
MSSTILDTVFEALLTALPDDAAADAIKTLNKTDGGSQRASMLRMIADSIPQEQVKAVP